MFSLSVMVSFSVLVLARASDETCSGKFEYVFKVLERLSDVESKLTFQEEAIARLTRPLKDNLTAEIKHNISLQEQKVASLVSLLQDVEAQLRLTSTLSGDTYTRWGRFTCPNGSTVVYDGFAAGSHSQSKGGAANYLCLTKQPLWNDNTTISSSNLIYGAEYETKGTGLWYNLHNTEVPCAVCRVPRRSVLMVPGKNQCHGNYSLEYSGYLMSGHGNYDSATEFVCVDDAAESVPGSTNGDENGRLFYFVTAKCGALKCPRYEEGKKLTCAVCSI